MELMGDGVGVVVMEEEREEEVGEVVNWRKYLPHMPVKVLLVEGDDSTRQIIAALLRKCSYRVAAVADGMKAWETLKEKSNNIDLVLTEVELPFLSGFGLLTMIMEHHSCKNIPVIMMSSHDSMSMVFKCMLKGAADFLVKPIRKNELSNLWQHVWRRQIANGGNGVMQGSQQMNITNLEIEDKMNIDKMSGGNGNAAILEKSKELSEQRSDAQSSCTRSDMEAESKQQMQTRNLNLLSINISSSSKASAPKISIQTVDKRKDDDAGVEIERENHENEHHLELSLRRYEYYAPPVNEQKENEEKNNNKKLNHSNSSPFSLYNNSRLRVSPVVATSELITECITPVSISNVVNLNLTPDKSFHDMPILHSAPIKSVPIIASGGFPLDQLFCTSTPLPDLINNKVIDIEEEEEEEVEMNTNNTKENNDMEMSQGASDSRSSNVPSLGSSCIIGNNNNNDGLRCLTQREIALNKFRMKRKERCFEKKVRYQSRKLLAEKRPRVKGQFVRQDQMIQDAKPCHAAK